MKKILMTSITTISIIIILLYMYNIKGNKNKSENISASDVKADNSIKYINIYKDKLKIATPNIELNEEIVTN